MQALTFVVTTVVCVILGLAARGGYATHSDGAKECRACKGFTIFFAVGAVVSAGLAVAAVLGY